MWFCPRASIATGSLRTSKPTESSRWFHYVPLHSSAAGKKFSARAAECPVADDISSRILRLPFYNDMTRDEQSRVISGLMSYARQSQRKAMSVGD